VEVHQVATEVTPDLVCGIQEFQNAFVRASEDGLAFGPGERVTGDGLFRE
jgi:hypothetical protein